MTDTPPDRLRSSANQPATDGGETVPDPAAYDAIVYDLDGTLVELAVDWESVAAAVLEVYAANAVKPPTTGLWELLEAAEGYGIHDPVEEAIALHERPGARESMLLPLGERLSTAQTDDSDASDGPPVGVCSLNCEDACRIALDTHDLADAVVSDAVVGRDTVGTRKPEPESLLAAVDRLDAEPEHALFVGDSETDAIAARRAGVDFVWVSALLDR